MRVPLQVVLKHAPVIQLDAAEPCKPMCILDYIAGAEPRSRSSRRRLSGGCLDYFHDPSVYFEYTGQRGPPTQADKAAPVYYKAESFTRNGVLFYSILYMFFYSYQEPFKVLKLQLGAHSGDLEHVRVFVRADTGKVVRVYFAAHGPNFGEWAYGRQCRFFDRGHKRVMVYSARISHASYRKPGVYVRAFGAINDVCDGRGIRWNVVPNIVPYPCKLLLMKAMLGPSTPNAPRQRWWHGELPHSARFVHRLLQLRPALPDPTSQLHEDDVKLWRKEVDSLAMLLVIGCWLYSRRT